MLVGLARMGLLLCECVGVYVMEKQSVCSKQGIYKWSATSKQLNSRKHIKVGAVHVRSALSN